MKLKKLIMAKQLVIAIFLFFPLFLISPEDVEAGVIESVKLSYDGSGAGAYCTYAYYEISITVLTSPPCLYHFS